MSPWNEQGLATIAARGADARSVIETALQAILSLTLDRVSEVPAQSSAAARSAPVRGEGDDLASLVADLAEDLLAQLEHFGAGIETVTIDGLLRRDDRGYVAWGYVTGTLDTDASLPVPQLAGPPGVSEDVHGAIALTVTLRQS